MKLLKILNDTNGYKVFFPGGCFICNDIHYDKILNELEFFHNYDLIGVIYDIQNFEIELSAINKIFDWEHHIRLIVKRR